MIPCSKTFSKTQVDQFKWYIKRSYHYKLYLDELPSATIIRNKNGVDIVNYYDGIPIGYTDTNGTVNVFNHLEITVDTHKTYDGHERIVAFDVEPFSLADDADRMLFSKRHTAKPRALVEGEKIRFTYSVHTNVNPNMTWSTRMDHFMKTGNNEVHMMQLIISMLIVCCLGVLVAVILRRALG
jgi:hypothetical protein